MCAASLVICPPTKAASNDKPISKSEAELSCAQSVLGSSSSTPIPKLSTEDARKLLEIAFNGLSAALPINVFRLSEPHLRELIVRFGAPYETLKASQFAEKALQTWTELPELGATYSHQLQNLVEPLKQYAREDAQLALLSVDDLTHDKIKEVEASILDVRSRAIHISHEKNGKRDPTKLLDKMNVLFGKIAALQLAAYQSSNQDLKKAVEDLLRLALRLAGSLNFIKYLEWILPAPLSLDSRMRYSSVAGHASEAARDPDFQKDLLEILHFNYTPQEHAKIIHVLFSAPTISGRPVMTSNYRFARAVHALHNPDQELVTHFGSHPVVDRLFALGGRPAVIETADGSYQGTIQAVRDLDPDKDGDVPVLQLDNAKIDLTKMTSLSVDGQKILDIKIDGPIKARTFAKIDPIDLKQIEIFEFMKPYIVGSYAVDWNYVDLLMRTMILGEPVPYHKIGERHGDLKDFLTNHSPLPVKAPEDSSAFVAEYRRLLQLSAEGIRGTRLLRDLITSIVLVKRLSSLLQLDLPSQRKETLAKLAASLANNGNVRLWGLHGGSHLLVTRGPQELLRQVEQRLSINQRTEELVASGTEDSRLYVEEVLADRIIADLKSMQEFEEDRILDKRLRSTIHFLAGSDAGFHFF